MSRRVATVLQAALLLAAAAAAGIVVNLLLLGVADDRSAPVGKLSPRGVIETTPTSPAPPIADEESGEAGEDDD
jgi:hypothetical protein